MKTMTNNSFRVVVLVLILLIIRFSPLSAQFSVGNTLAPLAGNPYPIVYANDAKGGHHQVANIAARNAITALRRIPGMLCTVLDAGSGTPKTYQLLGGILDTNWVEFTTGIASRVTTNANLTGEVTSVGNEATVTNSAVIGKVLTGYTSGAGVISSGDNILQAIQKLNGNVLTTVWNLTGNGGTTPGTNFIGTTDDKDVIFKRNGVQSGLLNGSNTSFGLSALNPVTTGNSNVALGINTLAGNTSGNSNVATGSAALYDNTTGNYNIAIGQNALNSNTTGSGNTAIGYHAGYTDGTTTTPATLTNATAIGNKAQVTSSNSVVLGGTGFYAANVGIGTTSPAYKLDVVGDIRASGNVTANSDIRLKKNIRTLGNVSASLRKINAVEFDRKDITAHQIGFIAQNVQQYFPDLVTVAKDSMATLSLNYQAMTAPLLKGWQEHDAIIVLQQAQINTQHQEIELLKQEIEILKINQEELKKLITGK